MSACAGEAWPRRAVLAILLAALGACGEPRSIELCGRGDRVEFAGGVRISFLNEEGRVLEFGEVMPEPSDHLDLAAPAGAVEVMVEGKDGAGLTVAHGRAALDEDGACVCVAQESQYLAACEGIACRVQGGSCQFLDEGTGELAAAHTIFVGDNSDDTGGGTRDTFLRASNLEGNFGQAIELDISSDESAVVWFDLSLMPTTSQIEDAELTIHATENGTSEDVLLSRILEPWDEGGNSDGAVGAASWLERRTGTPWTAPGCGAPGSREATPLASAAVPPDSPAVIGSAALTGAVQQWVAEPASNFGVAVSCGCDAALVSSEGQDGLRPRLSVTYSLP